MEHAAAIDVPGMEAAGISLEDFVYYHCRVNEATCIHNCVPHAEMQQNCTFVGAAIFAGSVPMNMWGGAWARMQPAQPPASRACCHPATVVVVFCP